MLRKDCPLFNDLLSQIDELPVIDCHEHMMGPDYIVPFAEPIAALIAGYYSHDLLSAGLSEEQLAHLSDSTAATGDKWPLFEEFWRRTQHTAYGRVVKLVLQNVYNEPDMSLAALERASRKLADRDSSYYRKLLEDANIRLIITDALGWPPGDFGAFLGGEQVFEESWHPVVPLPLFHVIGHHGKTARDRQGVQQIAQWANRSVTSLDEFTEAVFDILKRAKARGAIALKDQCAYNRPLAYEVVAKSDAEPIFNRLLNDSNALLGWPESKPLDDYLFHQYMRFARELNYPVQIHTGHMAGTFNRVDKANVALFTSVLELHRDVKFDLFHGNWPYMGDLLFIGKNYPNVALNLTWLPIVDPLYARELLERVIVTVPHSKIHAFGGDYSDLPEQAIAHLTITKHVIAAALANHIEAGWMTEIDARQLAADWLYNNPRRFFELESLAADGTWNLTSGDRA